MSRESFVEDWWCSAVQVGLNTGFLPELVLATWAADTGWGVATGMMNCHALLGIVCFDPDRYPCTLCNPSLCFYCYPTWDDFFATFTEVLNQSHYDVVRIQTTLIGQTDALANHTGFAGGSPTYYGLLIGVENILATITKPLCGIAQHYPASGLAIGQFWITNCVISSIFYWTRGGPNLIGQRLDLAVYPLGFEQGRSYNVSADRSSVPFTGFAPNAGYYWRIVSFFSDSPELYSPQHTFIVPALPSYCVNPPYYPWPFIPPEQQNITMLLGAGLVATSLILAATPRKKKVIIKR
jgi:hypothetical protein